jgi:hypothetical protein
MWTGDTLHGPVIGGKKSYLFAFIDDHSRAVMGARWAHHDDVVRMAAAFRPALCSRPFKVSMKVPFAVSAGWREEPRRAGCRAGFWWPGWRGGGQSVAVSSAIAVRAADSSAMVLPAV